MEITINTLSVVRQEADISLTSDELQPHFEAAYKKYQPKVEFKGFRKGKVPMDLIKKVHGEAIEYEARWQIEQLEDDSDRYFKRRSRNRKGVLKTLGSPFQKR